jgi:GNAT superfamily N-acetyltransferase
MHDQEIEIKFLAEFNIEEEAHVQITEIRNCCFPETAKKRSYFKQLPHFRFLAYEGLRLVGQMGVDHRVISVGDSVFKIFGVIDLCVVEEKRGLGIGSSMLQSLAGLAQEKSVDFLFFVADNHQLYLKNGFTLVSNYFQWLRIDEHKNYGVAIEKIDNEILAKKIKDKEWSDEPVDLLGYLL